uniref:Photosystem I assembly protein Ycf4 n=1 Tax=Passiflora pittieri TaxID=196689 RepID=A0A2Z5D695_PASPT|nr:photosystem I assembly protein Ycf4 [Passiflora pittieri]AXB37989.1 photosystem I assembly protein Ycf4 [Passiflora pittieri]
MTWKPTNRHNWLKFLRESRIEEELRYLCNLWIWILILEILFEIVKRLIRKFRKRFYLVGERLRDWEPPLRSPAIIPFPQGVLMLFYGITGRFVSFYSQCTNFWNGGSDYDRFDTKTKFGIAYFLRWGFTGPDCRMLIPFFMKDIKAVRIHLHGGIFAHFMLFLEVRGMGSIALLRTEDYETVEERAYQLSDFLDIPITKSWFR